MAQFFGTPLLHQILTDFLSYFTFKIRKKIVIILLLKIPPHLKCVATLPCEMSSVLKATIKNKTTSVTTHFKEIHNREQRVYCLSYCLK